MMRPSRIKAKRNSDTNSIYQSARWKRFSIRCLHEEPLCQRCRALGIVEIAVHSHHKIKLSQRPDLAFVRTNIMSVCQPCHRVLDQ